VIALQGHLRDLDLIPKARRLTHSQGSVVPRHMVVCAIGIEFQRLLRPRYCNLCVCVLSRQIAHQADLFVFREFVVRMENTRRNERKGKGG